MKRHYLRFVRSGGASSSPNGSELRPAGSSATSPPREQSADFYDRIHVESNTPENRALYYPLFRKVVATLRDHGSRSILEVGCGNGYLAQILLREHAGNYRGFDFNAVALRHASDRTGRPEVFFQGDALDERSYAGQYDTIVCTEVLEHIEADLEVIRFWRDGTWCACTVPNFDYPSHVRFFRNADEVAARYGGLIDINAILKVPRPIMPDGRVRTYLRNLRWSRDDPSRFLGYLGVQTFDRLGGWFFFYGTKKYNVTAKIAARHQTTRLP